MTVGVILTRMGGTNHFPQLALGANAAHLAVSVNITLCGFCIQGTRAGIAVLVE